MPTGTVKMVQRGQGLRLHHPGRGGRGPIRSTSPGLRPAGRPMRGRVSFDAEQGDKGPKAVNVREL
jgi:hypothetical protein